MKRTFAQISVLALSFGLVASYSISAALPRMREFYAGFPADRVDLLISVPSFAIFLVMIVNLLFSRYIHERFMIVGGLTLYTAAGLAPLVYQGYGFVLCMRFLLGIGSGMVNTQAVSVISRRYEGETRTRLLGYRGSVEALGNAVLTMIAGGLLLLGWKMVFGIYAVGAVILALYLAGERRKDKMPLPENMPHGASGKEDLPRSKGEKSQGKQAETNLVPAGQRMLFCICCAVLGVLLIGANTVLSMRIPVFIEERGLGTSVQTSMILSGTIVAGIISGLFYGKMKGILKAYFAPVMLAFTCLGMLLVCLANQLPLLALSCLIFGSAYPIVVTDTFQNVSMHLPQDLVGQGTTCVLIGCNLGAFVSTYAMKLIALRSARSRAPVLLYCFMILFVLILMTVQRLSHMRSARQ